MSQAKNSIAGKVLIINNNMGAISEYAYTRALVAAMQNLAREDEPSGGGVWYLMSSMGVNELWRYARKIALGKNEDPTAMRIIAEAAAHRLEGR